MEPLMTGTLVEVDLFVEDFAGNSSSVYYEGYL